VTFSPRRPQGRPRGTLGSSLGCRNRVRLFFSPYSAPIDEPKSGQRPPKNVTFSPRRPQGRPRVTLGSSLGCRNRVRLFFSPYSVPIDEPKSGQRPPKNVNMPPRTFPLRLSWAHLDPLGLTWAFWDSLEITELSGTHQKPM
jgi:hypothetical protein